MSTIRYELWDGQATDTQRAAIYDLLYLADPSPEIVSDYLNRGDCFLAYLDDRLIGEFVLLPTRPSTIELINVAVCEQLHGRGYGKQLVLEAIRLARERGYKAIEVGTGNPGVVQMALYQKCGFRITSVDLDFFTLRYPEPIIENGIPCRDMIRMQMELR